MGLASGKHSLHREQRDEETKRMVMCDASLIAGGRLPHSMILTSLIGRAAQMVGRISIATTASSLLSSEISPDLLAAYDMFEGGTVKKYSLLTG